MSEFKDKKFLILLGIAAIVGGCCVAITALFLVFSPSNLNNTLVPVVGALAGMGAVLGYFIWKKE